MYNFHQVGLALDRICNLKFLITWVTLSYLKRTCSGQQLCLSYLLPNSSVADGMHMGMMQKCYLEIGDTKPCLVLFAIFDFVKLSSISIIKTIILNAAFFLKNYFFFFFLSYFRVNSFLCNPFHPCICIPHYPLERRVGGQGLNTENQLLQTDLPKDLKSISDFPFDLLTMLVGIQLFLTYQLLSFVHPHNDQEYKKSYRRSTKAPLTPAAQICTRVERHIEVTLMCVSCWFPVFIFHVCDHTTLHIPPPPLYIFLIFVPLF